jgi:hypothetical protein
VMFCDLVHSTGIAAKLDAEEWRDLVGAYIDAASAAVVEMGAGNLTLLGSVANLIVAERARTASRSTRLSNWRSARTPRGTFNGLPNQRSQLSHHAPTARVQSQRNPCTTVGPE